MKKTLLSLCSMGCACVLAAGAPGPQPAAPQPAAPQPEANVKKASGPSPTDVMVRVNDRTLTRAELEADVSTFISNRVAGAGVRLAPERLGAAKKTIAQQMMQQFVMRELLLGAAREKNVNGDQELKTEEERLAKLAEGNPKAPRSFAELAARHPLGPQRGMQELRDTLTIKGLLRDAVLVDVKVDSRQIKEALARANRGHMDAERKDQAIHAKILKIREELVAIKDRDALVGRFAEIAKEQSECPSGKSGGALGEFGRGRMVAEFEKVAFDPNLQPFTVSEPVRTKFGWHLIMVTERIPAMAKPGESTSAIEKVKASHILFKSNVPRRQTREQVERTLRRQAEQAAVQAYLGKLRKRAKVEMPGLVEFKAKSGVIESKPVAARPDGKGVESKPVAVTPGAKGIESKPVSIDSGNRNGRGVAVKPQTTAEMAVAKKKAEEAAAKKKAEEAAASTVPGK